MSEMLDLEEVGRQMIEKLKSDFGAPEDTPVYLLWGETPADLMDLLNRFAKEEHLGELHRISLMSALPEVRERGFNMVALMLLGHRLHIRGKRIQVIVPLKG